MGILKIYTDKINKENEKTFAIKDLKSFAQGNMPKDIRRGPGGHFEKQPEFQYPDMGLQPYNYEQEISDTVRSLFNIGSKDFAEALHRLEFVNERITGLEQSLASQYPDEFDVLPIQVALQTSIKNLTEIKKYFDDGASGTLNLKMSQKAPPQALITIHQYLNDALAIFSELYKNIQVLYNQASNKLDPTQKDVRALLWEATYAFQAIRDCHEAIRSQYSRFTDFKPDELSKPQAPEKPKDDSLELQPNAPKEITIPEYKFDSPQPLEKPTQPESPKEVIQIPPPSQVVKEPKTPEEKNPVIPPPEPKTRTPQPERIDSTEPKWKSLESVGAEEEFTNIFDSMLDTRNQHSFNKWMQNFKAPTTTIFPLKNGEFIEAEKNNDGELIRYRLLSAEYVKKMTEDRLK